MDMLAKQLSQIATSLSEIRGNEGRIPASVKPSDRENISQDKNGEKPVPQEADQHFSGPGVEVEIEEIKREAGESSKGDSSNKERQVKPFPYRGELKKKKKDPVDFIDILGKLEINLSFVQALKLPIFSKFIKEFIAGKTKPSHKIVIRETVSAVIQKRRMPSKRTDPELMQEQVENSKLSHSIDKVVANWCSAVNTLGMTDEELAEAILEFCKSPESVRSKGSACVAKVENLPEPEGLIIKEVKKNPLPQDTSSSKKELKTLPPDLRYAYLEKNEMFSVIINSNLTREQEEELLEVLRRNKTAIKWTLSDLVGISPDLCMHHIRLEEGAKPHRDPQRKLNPNMRKEILKEVLKLLSLRIIYSIPDSKWVSPVHMLPKKSGIQVVTNEKNELVPTRLVTGWRMCIDYRKLNEATRKDHFPLPFIDQMLERLACKKFFCFLDEYSGYFQIYVNPKDQEKTTFTCPFGTYAYIRMPFGLCNAPGTFQRCMMSIFSDLLEECIEIFMDDFTVYGNSFEVCLANLDLVDKAKVDVISRIPYPTNQKEIRGFLGHARFYRRFIKAFAKIAQPLTHLLQNDVDFNFDEACEGAFQLLKERLVSAPIIRAPDWNYPFEVMCDTSDYAVGAVLGQRIEGKNYVIFYASKTLNQAQKNYDTTEKEMLAVV
ncbi:uncharacterized protein LOC121796898 [Salvia splendens]|uniref:uncharacterized protein LOC121796898 n=1 Tax=Salvia splendens TaxID=180675 RepID=UPI001C27FEF7|nr:uncharacterized protein LOC121796898 [Salvia splendens]